MSTSALKLAQFPRVIRQDFSPDRLGSYDRFLFEIGQVGIADFYGTIIHCTVGGPKNSEIEFATFGTIDGKPAHIDEAMGLLSGDLCDPDIGYLKITTLLWPHVEDDYDDWVEFRKREQSEADAQWSEDRAFFISQKGLKA